MYKVRETTVDEVRKLTTIVNQYIINRDIMSKETISMFNRKTRNNLVFSVNNDSCFTLLLDDKIIGVIALIEKNNLTFVLHTAVMPEYSKTKATAYLYHYLFNILYKDTDIYIGETNSFLEPYLTKQKDNTYLINNDIKIRLARIFNGS